jgi:hypothetical protein
MIKKVKRMDYLSKIERDTIYCSDHHRIIIKDYYKGLREALENLEIKDTKLLNEVLRTILNYSNEFSDNNENEYFYEWLRIIPTNMTYAISGFIAGIQNDKDKTKYQLSHLDIIENAVQCIYRLPLITLEDE